MKEIKTKLCCCEYETSDQEKSDEDQEHPSRGVLRKRCSENM